MDRDLLLGPLESERAERVTGWLDARVGAPSGFIRTCKHCGHRFLYEFADMDQPQYGGEERKWWRVCPSCGEDATGAVA